MQPSRYYAPIDGLRAVTVLSVFVYHLNETVRRGGHSGADVFFLISGFVVTDSIAGSKFDGRLDFQRHFDIRRILLIASTLLVCLLATTVARSLIVPSSRTIETALETILSMRISAGIPTCS